MWYGVSDKKLLSIDNFPNFGHKNALSRSRSDPDSSKHGSRSKFSDSGYEKLLYSKRSVSIPNPHSLSFELFKFFYRFGPFGFSSYRTKHRLFVMDKAGSDQKLCPKKDEFLAHLFFVRKSNRFYTALKLGAFEKGYGSTIKILGKGSGTRIIQNIDPTKTMTSAPSGLFKNSIFRKISV